MTPSQIRQRLVGMTEQAYEFIENVMEAEPLYRTDMWEWAALKAMIPVAANLMAQYKSMVLVPSELSYDDVDSIRELNEALSEYGIPCANPVPEDANSWIMGFGQLIGAW
jgi:hypothetical protein